jgi:lathosterol oxidase
MLQTWIFANWGVAGMLGLSLSFALTLYAAGASLSYYWFFRRDPNRYVPDHIPNWRENRKAICLSMISIVGNALLFLPIQLAIIYGHSRLYGPVWGHGWGWAAGSIIGAVLFAESSIYWIHRALHTPTLFRWLHRRHHEFRAPTPFVSYAFHPLDDFAQALPYHVYVFFVPMPETAYLMLVGFAAVWTLLIHDRVVWVSATIVNNAGCHTAHHWYFRYNYGNYFTFWDRIVGTYFDPVGLPSQFYAAKYGSRRRRDVNCAATGQSGILSASNNSTASLNLRRFRRQYSPRTIEATRR